MSSKARGSTTASLHPVLYAGSTPNTTAAGDNGGCTRARRLAPKSATARSIASVFNDSSPLHGRAQTLHPILHRLAHHLILPRVIDATRPWISPPRRSRETRRTTSPRTLADLAENRQRLVRFHLLQRRAELVIILHRLGDLFTLLSSTALSTVAFPPVVSAHDSLPPRPPIVPPLPRSPHSAAVPPTHPWPIARSPRFNLLESFTKDAPGTHAPDRLARAPRPRSRNRGPPPSATAWPS